MNHVTRKGTIEKYIGRKYGRLTILGFARRDPNNAHHYFFHCQCECGTKKDVRLSNMQQGTIKSCGCYAAEKTRLIHSGNTYRRLPKGHNVRNQLFHTYQLGAKKRHLQFTLSLDEFESLIKQNCFYCGSPPSRKRTVVNANGSYTYNGIDRVDNSIGYVQDNCVACCNDCNTKKNSVTKEIIVKSYEFLHRPK